MRDCVYGCVLLRNYGSLRSLGSLFLDVVIETGEAHTTFAVASGLRVPHGLILFVPLNKASFNA